MIARILFISLCVSNILFSMNFQYLPFDVMQNIVTHRCTDSLQACSSLLDFRLISKQMRAAIDANKTQFCAHVSMIYKHHYMLSKILSATSLDIEQIKQEIEHNEKFLEIEQATDEFKKIVNAGYSIKKLPVILNFLCKQGARLQNAYFRKLGNVNIPLKRKMREYARENLKSPVRHPQLHYRPATWSDNVHFQDEWYVLATSQNHQRKKKKWGIWNMKDVDNGSFKRSQQMQTEPVYKYYFQRKDIAPIQFFVDNQHGRITIICKRLNKYDPLLLESYYVSIYAINDVSSVYLLKEFYLEKNKTITTYQTSADHKHHDNFS